MRYTAVLIFILVLIVSGCVSSNKPTYDIVTAHYSINEIEISYPQLTQLRDKDKQNQINELLKNDALQIFHIYDENDPELLLEIDFDVMYKSANVLSVQYKGGAYRKGAAHPNNDFYTTNIDIQNATKIRLNDLVLIDKDLISKFRTGKYTPFAPGLDLEEEDVLNWILGSFSDEDLIRNFNQADDSSANAYSYLTSESLGISIGIPHPVGDHFEIEIDYQHIRSHLKMENAIWKDMNLTK